jgi:hypothetical protein
MSPIAVEMIADWASHRCPNLRSISKRIGLYSRYIRNRRAKGLARRAVFQGEASDVRYVPPISPVDIILVIIVAAGSIVLAMLRSREPGVEEDRSQAGSSPDPDGRERLMRHYRRKWGFSDNGGAPT